MDAEIQIIDELGEGIEAYPRVSPGESVDPEKHYRTDEVLWQGFAESIMEGAHRRGLLAKRPVVTAITTAEFPTPASRPAWSVLDNASLARDWRLTLPTWQAGLDAVLDELAAAA